MSFPTYPKYKHSSIEWLGEVPHHWRIQRLKHQLTRNDGGVWGDDPVGDGDTMVLRSTEQTVDGRWQIDAPAVRSLSDADCKAALLIEGDLLLTKSSGSPLHIGKTCLVDGKVASLKCCYSNFMQRLRMKASFDPKLAWYVLNSRIARVQLDLLSNSTTGLANLNGTVIGQLEIPVPPLEEQSVITAFLDRETAKIDALIAEQQRLIELLQEKRQAIISHVVTEGLDRASPKKDSGSPWLRNVPQDWAVVPLKYLISKIEQGWSPQCDGIPVQSEIEWGVLKVGCVNGGVFDPRENKSLPSHLEPLPELGIMAGDVLVSRANTRQLVGSAAVSMRDYPRLLLCDKLYRLRVNHSRCTPPFLTLFLGSRAAREPIELAATGASPSMVNIGQSVLSELLVGVPSLEEQRAIEVHLTSKLSQFDAAGTHANVAIALLADRRCSLITDAVTGKIDVRKEIA